MSLDQPNGAAVLAALLLLALLLAVADRYMAALVVGPLAA
jgi:fructose-1,6-bisphosphatase/sedoheptulose 1,7-bisphosphatase-like protein